MHKNAVNNDESDLLRPLAILFLLPFVTSDW